MSSNNTRYNYFVMTIVFILRRFKNICKLVLVKCADGIGHFPVGGLPRKSAIPMHVHDMQPHPVQKKCPYLPVFDIKKLYNLHRLT